MDDSEQLKALSKQGFFCSQILILQGLQLMGKDNPDLVRAMQGLAGGVGFSGELCGALTGGAALIGLYAGRGTAEEEEDPRLLFMVEDLVKWFKKEYSEQFGGIRCDEIVNGSGLKMVQRCPILTAGVFKKVKELLVENGFDLSGVK